MNTGLLTAGVTLLLVALLSRWVTIGGNQIARAAPWWVAVLVGVPGALAIAWALAASRERLPALRTAPGFLGAPPKMPDSQHMINRPDVAGKVATALRARGRPVALTGIGGAGKSTLAAAACLDRQVRRRFRDGVAWLDAGPGQDGQRQDPVVLLGDLGQCLGLPDSESGFTTVKQGCNKISAVLAGKRVLVAVDNVWERGPLDALVKLEGCTVLFTTRLAGLAATFGATEIEVDELTRGQALELLGRWTGQAPARLPAEAGPLCTRVGNLALGVTMAGAMVAQGRSFTDVLALIEQDLARVHADLHPEYQYRNLLAAIEAGISDLPETSQHQYAQLAVFAGHGPFPREAAAALWQSDLTQAEVGDLLAVLTGRSLLTTAGEGWYAAHDLQYDVLKRKLGPGGLTAAHERLLEGYRTRYPAGWGDSATDPYLSGALAGHLHHAGRDSDLRDLLADVAWIQARLAAAQLPGLLADYGYASDLLSKKIARALRLSAHILAADPGQVRGQLAGRLLGHPDPAVANWATALTTQDGPGPWLAPLTPALTPTTAGLEQVLAGHDTWVVSVAVTTDGTRAVSGGSDKMRVWDLDTGALQHTLAGHGGGVSSVAVTADGTRAVSGGHDGTVRVWDLVAGREQAELTGHQGGVSSVAVTADGTRAVSGGHDGTVRVWDLVAGREQAELTGHQGGVSSVAVTADGTRAVSGGHDGTVRVWDLVAGREQAELPTPSRQVDAVAITADGTRAVSGGADGYDGVLRVWDLVAGREQAKFPSHFAHIFAVAVTPDGTRAVSGGEDGAVWVWDLVAGREQPKLPGYEGWVSAVAVSADGTRAVSGGHDGALRVLDLATGREQAKLPGHEGGVNAVAVTADGTRAVSGGRDGAVRVWDLVAGREQAKLSGHNAAVKAVAVTPDGTQAVSGGEGWALLVWDLAARREQAALTTYGRWVWSVAVTADGTRVVSGGRDGAVRVWDLVAGGEQAMFPGHKGAAHEGLVRAVAVTPDGTRAVSGGEDGAVHVWDLVAGREQAKLPTHDGMVRAVAITADGTRAVSGDEYGAVRVWDLASGKEAARWTGGSGILACIALPGKPLKIAVGQKRGQPYLLELRGQQNAT